METIKNILFVCNANVNRSPSFERWTKKNRPRYNVKSCGCFYSYYTPMDEEILEWADKIYVMDLEQETYISRKFHNFLDKVEVIGISDQYDPDETALIELIEYWVRKSGL